MLSICFTCELFFHLNYKLYINIFTVTDTHPKKSLRCNVENLSQKSASAGSRTRIDCLEGNHANRYTTDAAGVVTISWMSNSLFSHNSNNLYVKFLFYFLSKNVGMRIQKD